MRIYYILITARKNIGKKTRRKKTSKMLVKRFSLKIVPIMLRHY